MGLSKKLKAQSRLLLSVAILAIVIVGVGIAFVALSVPQQRAAVDDVFQDDVYADDSDAGGSVDITTTLRDDRDIIIRRTDPNIWDMPFAIIDPTTEKEVGSYGIELNFECWGKNIDWTTFQLTGSWELSQYIGIDDGASGQYIQYPDVQTQHTALETLTYLNPTTSVRADGMDAFTDDMIFQEVSIDNLMPDILYPPAGGGEQFPQRTAFDHEMTFVFDASFSLTVDDAWGNTYDSSYSVHIALCLVWSGSEFGVTWNPEDTTTTTSTSTTTTTPPTSTTTPPVEDKTTTTTVPDIPIYDDFGNPVDDPTADERVYVTNDDAQDVLAASLTGGTGTMMAVVIMLGIFVPIIVYWKFIKK